MTGHNKKIYQNLHFSQYVFASAAYKRTLYNIVGCLAVAGLLEALAIEKSTYLLKHGRAAADHKAIGVGVEWAQI